MEWTTLLNGALGASPMAGLLGFVSWKLWTKLEQREAELKAKDVETAALLKAKDAEIAELHEARISDLRAMLKPNP